MRHLFLFVSTLLLTPVTLHADGFAVPGFGAESVALGGARVADKSGPAALAYNPAGLNTGSQQTTLSYVWAKPILYISREANEALDQYLMQPPRENREHEHHLIAAQTRMNDVHEDRARGVSLIRGIHFGVVVPLAHEREEARTSLGVAVYLPQGRLASVELVGESAPFFVEFQDRNQAPVIAAGLGHDLSEKWSLGAGMVIDLVQVDVDANVFVPLRFAITDLLIGRAPLIPEADVQPFLRARITPRPRPMAGVRWNPTPRFAAGLAFREESHGRVDVSGEMMLASGLPREAVLGLNGELNTHFQPRRVSAGFQWLPADRLRLQGDLAWEQWSGYRPPLMNYAVNNLRQVASGLLAATGAADAGILGGCIGGILCLPTEEALLARVPDSVQVEYAFSGARDILLPRVGLGWQWSDRLEGLVGYSYRPSMEAATGFGLTRGTTYTDIDGEDIVLQKAVDTNVLDNARHSAGMGLSWQRDALSLGATLLFIHLVEKQVDKRDAVVEYEDRASASGLQITEFGYPGYRYGGLVAGGMIQMTLTY